MMDGRTDGQGREDEPEVTAYTVAGASYYRYYVKTKRLRLAHDSYNFERGYCGGEQKIITYIYMYYYYRFSRQTRKTGTNAINMSKRSTPPSYRLFNYTVIVL